MAGAVRPVRSLSSSPSRRRGRSDMDRGAQPGGCCAPRSRLGSVVRASGRPRVRAGPNHCPRAILKRSSEAELGLTATSPPSGVTSDRASPEAGDQLTAGFLIFDSRTWTGRAPPHHPGGTGPFRRGRSSRIAQSWSENPEPARSEPDQSSAGRKSSVADSRSSRLGSRGSPESMTTSPSCRTRAACTAR